MKTKVTIETVHADGSGAPATVTCCGYCFAAHYMGEVRLTLISNASSRPSSRVIESAKRAYRQALFLHPMVSAGWFDLNKAMYPAPR